MIYYAKLSKNKYTDKIINAFRQAGVSEEHIILDDSVVQKQEGCLFYDIKSMLVRTKESFTIDSLTSLGKNNREIYNELAWFDAHSIPLYILDIPKSTEDPNGTVKLLVSAFTALSEREIRNSKNGQVAGIESAKKAGKHMGRARIDYPDNWDTLYSQWTSKEITSKEFLQQSGLKKGTFYNLLKQYQTKTEEAQNNLA